MGRIQPKRHAGGQRGFALILVMVALVTLTILGVTAITAAQLDMKITQNMRHHKQLQYGALTGIDHVRDLAEDQDVDLIEVYTDAAGRANNCIPNWIHPTESAAVDLPTVIEANGFTLANYQVDICQAVCNQPPAGTGVESVSYVLDVVSNGLMTDATANARMGGFLFGRTSQVRTCNGLL